MLKDVRKFSQQRRTLFQLRRKQRTLEGLARSRRANWKHGWYSVEALVRVQALAKARVDTLAFRRAAPSFLKGGVHAKQRLVG